MFFFVAIPLTSAAEYWADFTSLTEKKPLGDRYRICRHFQIEPTPAHLSPVKAVTSITK